MAEYAVTTHREGDVLVAQVEGDFVDPKHALKAWVRVAYELRQLPAPKLLIARGDGVLASDLDLSEVIWSSPDIAPPGLRCAIVVQDPRRRAVIENVSAARGIAFRAFGSVDEALTFLA